MRSGCIHHFTAIIFYLTAFGIYQSNDSSFHLKKNKLELEGKKNPFSVIHAIIACVHVGQGEQPRHQWPQEVTYLTVGRKLEGQKQPLKSGLKWCLRLAWKQFHVGTTVDRGGEGTRSLVRYLLKLDNDRTAVHHTVLSTLVRVHIFHDKRVYFSF